MLPILTLRQACTGAHPTPFTRRYSTDRTTIVWQPRYARYVVHYADDDETTIVPLFTRAEILAREG